MSTPRSWWLHGWTPLAGLLFVTTVTALLAACGGNGDDSAVMPGHMSTRPAPAAPAAERHNGRDVMFAQMMIPHHQQAIEMARLAETRATRPEIKHLATAIEVAQNPEIQQMTVWLMGWNVAVPPGNAHMGQSTGEGMMSEQGMLKLEKMSGVSFDRIFIMMMIQHHEGAITMAKAEQSGGQFAPAKTLAGNIETSQSAEIVNMRRLHAM
jgi:uncharacterized protein (DUF305 family)